MIFEVLQIITNDLNSFLEEENVSLKNVAFIDSETNSSFDASDISLTLINIQEEFALKNTSNNYVTGTTVDYRNPKVYLNLFILFSINKSSYSESLKSLAKIIAFFQGKRVFTNNNTNYDTIDGVQGLLSFKIITQLHTPSFEELNHIWGTLGGKQYPSVLYKVTLVEVERDVVLREGSLITNVEKITYVKK